MKRLLLGVLSMFLLIPFAQAKGNQNLDAIAMALVLHDLETGSIELQDDGNIFDQIKDFIEETKTFLLENFDYNQNGRIDFGDELNDVVQTFKDIVVLLLDTNYNGKIEREEVLQAVKELADLIKTEVSAKACQEIIKKAEAAGDWLKYRPVLKALYNNCTAE